MNRMNPNVSKPSNGRQFLYRNCTDDKEFKFGHSMKSLSSSNYTTISDADGALFPLLLSFKEIYGEAGPHILFESSSDVTIDRSDPIVIDPASREALAWKTTPCKHYIRTQGWCPVGEGCQFIHDLTLQSSGHVNEPRGLPRLDSDVHSISNTVIAPLAGLLGRHKRGLPKSHCWSHVQDYCGAPYCRYFHPEDTRPYLKYTPCPQWIDCAERLNCPFKHPTKSSETATSDLPQISHPVLPACYPPVEVNGTTYFDLIGQNISYNYGFTSGPTTPQDYLSYEVDSSAISTPPPPPPSPVISEALPANDQTLACDNKREHSTPNDQRSAIPQTRRQNSHARRFSVAFKGSEGTKKEQQI